MGKHRDEIWQELRELDNRVTRLEDRAILKPECDPADVAFNRAQPWQWQVPTTRPAAPVDDAAQLRAENARLVAERDSETERANMLEVDLWRVKANRDALRARIDGGTVVWGNHIGLIWRTEQVSPMDKQYILIDIAPISDAVKMADERKGERRVAKLTAAIHSNVRMTDRRRTPGTVADRNP